ncbi:MAG: hypothetical protein Q8920_12805 [Bacillota bacterium]|nr:hypothetical protein [Bacillota bacterium]
MTPHDFTLSEKTLLIELVAREIMQLEKNSASKEMIDILEGIILKLEKM